MPPNSRVRVRHSRLKSPIWEAISPQRLSRLVVRLILQKLQRRISFRLNQYAGITAASFLILISNFDVAATARAETFAVVNTLDSGDGSLRAAIEAANANPNLPDDPDRIVFDLAGGNVIDLLTELPSIVEAVEIDGRGLGDTGTITVNGHAVPTTDQLFWAGLSGVVYLPSTVAPAGLTRSGLPGGLQIVGPYLADRTCIAFATLIEQHFGGFVAPPGYDG